MATSDKDVKLTRRQVENARASIGVGRIIQRLEAAGAGEVELTPAQVKAYQILLDKSLPTLQSIDQTVITETPELSPDEIEAQLQAYLAELKATDPAALRRLVTPHLETVNELPAQIHSHVA